MPKCAGEYAQFLKCASPSNPVASYYNARPFSPSQAKSKGKTVFPEFSAVYDSTISPSLKQVSVIQKQGPSWATGFPNNCPDTREQKSSIAPTGMLPRTSTQLTAKTAKRGTLILPESICRGVAAKPKAQDRERGQTYSHHPYWNGGDA